MSQKTALARVRPLNEKQRRFVAEYLIDMNGRQAAIRAGYKASTADVQASQLLRLPRIQDALTEARALLQVRTQIAQDQVLQELALLAFSSVDDYTVDDAGRIAVREGVKPDAIRAVSSVKHRITTRGTGDRQETIREVEFKLWDKPGSVKLAGAHVGLKGFAPRLEVTGKDGGPIEAAVKFYIPDNRRQQKRDE